MASEYTVTLSKKQAERLRTNAETIGITESQYAYLALTEADVTALIEHDAAFTKCSGCANVFKPSRRPRADTNSWCHDCRSRGRDKAHAIRKYRLRRKREQLASRS